MTMADTPMLMLGWYEAMPDRAPLAPQQPPKRERSSLSERLRKAFNGQLHCDLALPHAQDDGVAGHRLVLGRNPFLGFDMSAREQTSPAPPGVRLQTWVGVIRAHYEEFAGGDANAGVLPDGAFAALQEVRENVSDEEEWKIVELFFGPLDAESVSRWVYLKDVVNSNMFFDCTLDFGGGVLVQSHRFVIAGTDDGHYFSAALRWPGGVTDAPVVHIPDGLSQDAFSLLRRLRYGDETIQLERILEARHYADLFDWPSIRDAIDSRLELLLVDAAEVDAESLLSVVSHAEESTNMPPRLKAAALAAAVRQWSRVAEAASSESTLSTKRCIEFGALNRIRRRDGHVCSSLEEYLHAAADDLTEWESRASPSAPASARKQLELSWSHWHEMLFEYSRINKTDVAENIRSKVAARREALRQERMQLKTLELRLPPGRVWFEPSPEWREVPPNAICPGGLEYRFDLHTGRNYARLTT